MKFCRSRGQAIFYTMATNVINEVHLFKCGTNQVQVYVDDYKAFFIMLGTCRGAGDNFFTLNKGDWEILKKFINKNLEYSNTIEITAKEPL